MKLERIQIKYHRNKKAHCYHFSEDGVEELEDIDTQPKYISYLQNYCDENNFNLLSINDVVSNGKRYTVANIIQNN